MIGAFALAVMVSSLALAVVPRRPLGVALRRVRVARGDAVLGWRAHVRALPIVRSWRPVDEETLRLAELGDTSLADLAAAKLGAALLAVAAALLVSLPPVAAAVLGYVAFVAPSEWVRHRASARVRARREAVLAYVERVTALAAAGLTVERALAGAVEGAGPLVPLLRGALARAELGVPLFLACEELAKREHVDELRDLARDLGRSRLGGHALLPALVERREVLRLAHRATRLAAASRVDGELSLVLVLAYLPALLLLVVAPLFLGLLSAIGS